jgi:hypothetical protein
MVSVRDERLANVIARKLLLFEKYDLAAFLG